MYRKFRSALGSIAVKISLSLAAMGTMIAAAIVIGIVVFGSLSESLTAFSKDHLPAVKRGTSVIADGADVSSGLMRVLLARNTFELQEAVSRLDEARNGLGRTVAQFPADAAKSMDMLMAELDTAAGQMTSALTERFKLRNDLATAVEEFGLLAATATAKLEELQDAAHFDLAIGGEETISSVAQTLDQLVETDFPVLTGVLQAQADFNLLTGTAVAALESADPGIRSILRDLFRSASANLDGVLTGLSASVEMEGYITALRSAYETLDQLGRSDFRTSPTARQDILALRQTVESTLSSAIDDVSFTLSVRASDAASENEGAISKLLDVHVAKIRAAAQLDVSVSAVFVMALKALTLDDPLQVDLAQREVDSAAAQLGERAANLDLGDELKAVIAQLLAKTDKATGMLASHQRALVAQANAAQMSLTAAGVLEQIGEESDALSRRAMALMDEAATRLLGEAEASGTRMEWVGWISLTIFAIALAMTWLGIVRPMARLARTTERLSTGDTAPVAGFERSHGEIGRMATALAIFRDGMIERAAMQEQERVREEELRASRDEAERARREREEAERRADEERREAEHRRELEDARRREETTRAAEAERAARAAEQGSVVTALAAALDSLAAGDLSTRLETEFPKGYEELRRNFNLAADNLADLIRSLTGSVENVDRSSMELASAASDLARRTETSAATLEETSAAITELSATAKSSAERAKEANGIMTEARTRAERSSAVVASAIATMSEIEASSESVSTIVDLIENIAFQTNLLALNAGVEAARAGEDGRGFAVVATEVRALAQRSSDAAREINSVISRTRSQIERGVAQVGEAGGALTEIIRLVSSISERVAAISEASQEQSLGVIEIDKAIGMLDNATQQNAAVCEETAAASQTLTSEARLLAGLARRFRTSEDDPEVGTLSAA